MIVDHDFVKDFYNNEDCCFYPNDDSFSNILKNDFKPDSDTASYSLHIYGNIRDIDSNILYFIDSFS